MGQQDVATGQGALAIRGVPSLKSGTFGWQKLIGPEALARTSGSWSGHMGFGREMPPGMVEIVPRGYDLKAPGGFGPRATPSRYGTRKYLTPMNTTPLAEDDDDW